MNLRDQLLKAGIASKKQADAAQREHRRLQKVEQGHQEAKVVLERREAEQAAAERAAHEAERLRQRREAGERAKRDTALLTVRHLLASHRIRFRSGPQRFYHRSPDGREAWRLNLPEHLADDLRMGRVAVACLADDVILIDRATAERIETLRPEVLLFWNRGPVDKDPSQQLYDT